MWVRWAEVCREAVSIYKVLTNTRIILITYFIVRLTLDTYRLEPKACLWNLIPVCNLYPPPRSGKQRPQHPEAPVRPSLAVPPPLPTTGNRPSSNSLDRHHRGFRGVLAHMFFSHKWIHIACVLSYLASLTPHFFSSVFL